MGFANSVEKLWAFKQADKYQVFREVQPEIIFTAEDRRKIISDILDNCSTELIQLLQSNSRLPQTELKKVITAYMDEISKAAVDNANKDFAYELCWYLSEIVGLKWKANSERKTWGYWKIADGEMLIFNKKKAKSK